MARISFLRNGSGRTDQRSGQIRNSGAEARLLAAALDTFAERGFHGTTTRDIAARADLSPAALYVHFKSKRALLYLIIKGAHIRLIDAMMDSIKPGAHHTDNLRALVGAHVEFHALEHTAARVANHELPALRKADREEILKLRRAIEALIEEVIRTGVKAGDFSVDDLRATSFAVLSLGIGVSRWFSPRGRMTPNRLGQIYANLVVSMLTLRPERPSIRSDDRRKRVKVVRVRVPSRLVNAHSVKTSRAG